MARTLGPGADRWAIEDPHQPDTRITWNGHPHDTAEWDIVFGDEDDWDGSPGSSPCESPSHHGLRADRTRAHCAYVVKHYNPWLIDKEMHPRHGDVINSWCAVIARGAPGNRTVFEPADTILFVDDTGQATCIDGDDHHSGGPGAEAGTQPTHRYHGDDDFIDQHGDTINAGLPTNQRVIANAHVNGRCCDEIVAQGRHRNDGSINYTSQNSLNLTGRHDHKTVMF